MSDQSLRRRDDRRDGKNSSLYVILKTLFVLISLLVCGLTLLAVMIFGQIPSAKEIRGCMKTKMYGVDLCPGNAAYSRYDSISPYLIKTVVLTEDSSFWSHNGFDMNELQNSLKKNLREGRFARGGSTISQQLTKNLYLSKEKTLTRKLKEALLTLQIEKYLSKKEILEKYLNVVQFGKDLYGVKSASQFYFKKSPKDLDVIESAFLAFLLPSPEKYSKSFFTKNLSPFAEKRLSEIIDRMFEYDRINEEEYLAAKSKLKRFLRTQDAVDVPEEIQNIDESTVDLEEEP